MSAVTAEPAAGRIPAAAWRVAGVIAFGAFLSQLDASLVNVGLETIARSLGAGLADAQWVANGYLLALAVSLPLSGWLGRRVGVARLWLGALAAFTVTSALCGLAPQLPWLIAARVAQGLAGGLLIPAGQTVIGQAVGPGRLGRVMGTLGVPMTLAPALGPSAGGLLLRVASWPWLFWLNVPIGLVALLLGLRYLPRTAPAPTGRLDWPGLALVSLGVPLVVYGATERGPVPLLLGGVALLGFVAWSLRPSNASNPVLDVRLFRAPRFGAAAVAVACASAALFGAGLVFPLYFQLARGKDPLATGLLLISMSIGTAAALPVAGRLTDRFGGGRVAVVGGLLTVLATLPFALAPLALGEVTGQVVLVVRGMAVAAAMMPATTAAYRAVSGERLPDATTAVNILMRVGGALGGALCTVVLTSALARGAGPAFQASFLWLTGFSLLGVACALWLARAERRPGQRGR